jgi:hypothetical protein
VIAETADGEWSVKSQVMNNKNDGRKEGQLLTRGDLSRAALQGFWRMRLAAGYESFFSLP